MKFARLVLITAAAGLGAGGGSSTAMTHPPPPHKRTNQEDDKSSISSGNNPRRLLRFRGSDYNDDATLEFLKDSIVKKGNQMDNRNLVLAEYHLVESSCNDALAAAPCENWSDVFETGTRLYSAEIKIPCGKCVYLDASPGEVLYGKKLVFENGLNIVGKLILPNDGAIELYTKYIFVQGILSMPPPAEGSSNGLPSPEEGDRLIITLYGTDDLTFKADNATDNSHQDGEGVSHKAIVVAGGRLDIRAMDPTCPSWVKLQSISYNGPDYDVLTVGEDAARCWSTPGSRILLTSDTYDHLDSNTAIVIGREEGQLDQLRVFPLEKKKTAVDETFGYADFAVEVALLDRSLVIQGKEEIEDDLKTFGGHVIVLHTPMIEQHLEGALLTNMGQQGKLGKYPLHFHMSGNVEGSTLAKNVIWESNQRCIVIHGTHNVTIDSNVAFDNEGHCFVLEDGWERHNKFINNLGARTKSPSVLPGSRDEPRNVVGETDDFPATYWITNPTNHYIGNVAAGSSGPGFWFELKKRSPEKEFGTNINKNPRTGKLGTFANNTAHSNNFRAGFTTYHPGYTAPKGTVWTNTKSYKNKGNGLFFHGTQNIRVHGGLLADNNGAARNFGHAWAEYDGVTVIGRSAHVDQLVSQGRMAYQGCSRLGGLSIQPNQGQWKGATIKNCIFEGFDKGCTGGDSAIIWVEKDQVGEFDSAPIIYNNTVGPYDNPITACATEKAKVRYVAVEDRDGSLSNSGSPGFYVQNEEAVTNFLYESDCQEERECLRFCPNTCLRIGKVMISNDITTRGFKMYITDGGIMSDGSNRRAEILRGSFGPERSKVGNPHALMPFVLPAPKLGKYEITFKDRFGNPAWPGYAMIELERSPECGNLGEDFLKESHLELVIPESNERCKDLFYLDDYENEIFGWQDTFAGLEINQENETQSYFVSTNKRKKNGLSNVLILRAIDASCLKANPGRTYTLSGKIRITNADGNQVETDGTDMLSPMIVLHVNPSFTRTWRVATSADGWTEWSKDIQLPNDMSEAWEAFIVIKESSFNEFHVMDWSMELRNDLPPRMQDPIVQITNQETKHYLMVGDEGADFPFSGLDSTLLSPIKLQQDFCPTTGNYAEHELSSPCFLIVFEDFGANGRCMYARANGKWRQGLGLAASNKAADADHIWYLEQVECDSSENGCAIVRNAANGRSLYENNKFFRVGASPKGDQEWLWRDSHNWHFEIFGTDTELDLSLWASPAFTNRGE